MDVGLDYALSHVFEERDHLCHIVVVAFIKCVNEELQRSTSETFDGFS
jgi:hypothetical protein